MKRGHAGECEEGGGALRCSLQGLHRTPRSAGLSCRHLLLTVCRREPDLAVPGCEPVGAPSWRADGRLPPRPCVASSEFTVSRRALILWDWGPALMASHNPITKHSRLGLGASMQGFWGAPPFSLEQMLCSPRSSAWLLLFSPSFLPREAIMANTRDGAASAGWGWGRGAPAPGVPRVAEWRLEESELPRPSGWRECVLLCYRGLWE